MPRLQTLWYPRNLVWQWMTVPLEMETVNSEMTEVRMLALKCHGWKGKINGPKCFSFHPIPVNKTKQNPIVHFPFVLHLYKKKHFSFLPKIFQCNKEVDELSRGRDGLPGVIPGTVNWTAPGRRKFLFSPFLMNQSSPVCYIFCSRW